MEPDTTSRAVLAHDAYATDIHLAARQSLYKWQTPSYDLPGLVVDRIGDSPGPVLDVGCGNGAYLRRLRADRLDRTTIGIDIPASRLPSGLAIAALRVSAGWGSE